MFRNGFNANPMEALTMGKIVLIGPMSFTNIS